MIQLVATNSAAGSREAQVIVCGIAKHSKPFFSTRNNGLNNYLIRLQVEGCSKTLVNGRLTDVKRGDLLLYGPTVPYQLEIGRVPGHPSEQQPEQSSVAGIISLDYYLRCEGSWIDAWWQRNQISVFNHIEINDSVLTIWRQINREKRKGREENKEKLDYLLRVLCLTIEQLIHENKQQRPHAVEIAYHLKQFIETHATENLTLSMIADSVQLSVSRACALFKAAFHQSMMDYCIQVRTHIAKDLIRHHDIPLEQIAEMSGFRSYPHFCRIFRKRFGVPPTRFRSNHDIMNP